MIANCNGVGRFRRVLRGAALVHLHLAHPVGKYQLIAATIARSQRRTIVATHHLTPEPGEIALGPWQRAAWHRLFALYRRLIDRHIAISRYGQGMLTGRYHLDPDRVSVIYNGTDVDRFAPVTDAERAARRRQLLSELIGETADDGRPLICSVARLSRQKGLEDLVEAARTLTTEIPARYVVIGDGELRSSLEASVQRSGLEGVVILAGNRPADEVARWLSSADLFVLPSRFEGGPAIALIEAMASARPVIATGVGGTEELISSPEVGCLIPAGQPAALAAAIRELLADPARSRRMGERARERVVAKFTIRQSHASTLALYRAVEAAH